ncbi:MAG: WYL domain-containing protein [Candidatus Latescibacterota bacterium]
MGTGGGPGRGLRDSRQARSSACALRAGQGQGGLVLSFCAASKYEIRAWVLRHGARARVLDPVWRRDEVIAELKASLRAYGEA